MDDGTVIRTTVTSSAHDVVAFLREVQERFRQEAREHERLLKEGQQEQHDGREEDLHFLIVGLHTERRDGTAVLQLCVADRCLVYQIRHAVYVPAELEDFLASPDFCFVAVGVAGHVRRLREDCDLEVAHALDLRQVAATVLGRPELRDAVLHTLAREVMGTLIDKQPSKVTMSSNWAVPELSLEQFNYACIDAFVSFHVGRRLLCEPCV